MADMEQLDSNTAMEELDNSQWISTYGMVTAKRILERFQLEVDDRDVLQALKRPGSFIHTITQLPLRNLLNDLIRQQVFDYITYAQKLFVDYLLSPGSVESDETQGSYSRQELEEKRQQLVNLVNQFQLEEYNHFKLIAETQRHLIQKISKWNQNTNKSLQTIISEQQITINSKKMTKLINGVLCNLKIEGEQEDAGTVLNQLATRDGISLEHSAQTALLKLTQQQSEETANITEGLANFNSRTNQINIKMRDFRKEITQLIVQTNENISLLPEYKTDPVQSSKNKEDIYLDANLGEEDSVEQED